MTAFHTIAIPHDDILQGRLTMDVFAADLWEVFKDRGSEEYRSPQVFFQKTYPTEGLQSLLDVVQARLEGRGGDPVIQVQTPFGGGKTHAQIAMYHRAAEWGAKRVVMVGTAMGPKDTLWGLLEEQLTGKISQFDGLVAPGRGDALRDLLAEHQPVLILMDEVLEYMTKAAGVAVADSTLATQSMAFMQELSEVVGTLERVSLVVTLPASILEHYDEKAEQLFKTLQHVIGRKEKIYTPVQEHEITHVIRRRLFSHLDAKGMHKVIASFMDYALRESLLPAGVEPSEYRQRFEAAYPFLPEVVDVLYQRWGSYSTFQRTRGVLRLLALVVHALKDKALPYIGLADFDLGSQEIRRELLKHIGPEYDSVIAADITGVDAGVKKVNAGLGNAYMGLNLGGRVATTTFLYSFSGGLERGVTLGEIKRQATTLDNPSSVVAEAVEGLKGRLFFLQQQSGKYYFTNQPNLNRVLLTRMENILDEDIRAMEEELLKARLKGDKLKVYIWREQSSDIPDTPDLKLVVLAEDNEKKRRTILEEKGGTPRVNRNTLIFLVPLANERTGFETLTRKTLAFRTLHSDPTLTLNAEQHKEVKDGLKRLEGDLAEAVRRLYRIIYLPGRNNGWKDFDLGIPAYGENRSLDQEIYDKLRMEGEILEKLAARVIKEKYLVDKDSALTEQLVRAGWQTPGEPRPVSTNVWEGGITEGVRLGMFGLGDLENGQPVCEYFHQEPLITLSNGEIIIKASICEEQRAAQAAAIEQGKIVYPPGQQPTGAATGAYESGTGAMTPVFTTPGGQTTFPPAQTVKGQTQLSFNQLNFNFVVPKGKVSSLMGVLNFLQSKYNRIQVKLLMEDGQLTEQEYEDKVKEAFRQMGIEIE